MTASHDDKAAQLAEFESCLDDLEKQLGELRSKNEALTSEVDRLRSGGSRSADSIEQEASGARERLEEEVKAKVKASLSADFERRLEKHGQEHDEEIVMLKKVRLHYFNHVFKNGLLDKRWNLTDVPQQKCLRKQCGNFIISRLVA